jgi:uncharacterized membrane protein
MVCKMFEIGYPMTSFHVTQVPVMHSLVGGFCIILSIASIRSRKSTRARIKKLGITYFKYYNLTFLATLRYNLIEARLIFFFFF